MLLPLPFFAPAMLGTFATHFLLRPRRGELAAAVALAAIFAWPLATLVTGEALTAAMAIAIALGAASMAVLLAMAIARSGAERHEVLDVLLPSVILPCFVVLAYPMVHLTAAVWPTTYDHRLYLADAAFGAPLSFEVGRMVAAIPLLPQICMAVYVSLPLALMLVHALRLRQNIRSVDALVAFFAITVVGYFGYLAVPVAGPVYAFGDLFPLDPPDPATLSAAKSVVLPMPRNCMPSLHSAWALLVWCNARPFTRGPRTAAAVFLAITLLATVALGYHYVVDVVAAFPLTMAVQAWATRVTDPRLRRRSMVAGAAMTVAWIALVTWSDSMLLWPPPVLWLLAAAVVTSSALLERAVASVSMTAEPVSLSAAPQAPLPHDCAGDRLSRAGYGAAFLLVLAGLAASLHWAILANALELTFGNAAAVRAMLLAMVLTGVAAGIAAGGMVLREVPAWIAAAGAASGLALWFGVAPQMLPWIRDGYLAAAAGAAADARVLVITRIGLAACALVPSAAFTGALAAFVARRLLCDDRRAGRVAALVVGLPLFGAALGFLAIGYGVQPSLRSRNLPVALAVVLALLASASALAAAFASRATAVVASRFAAASAPVPPPAAAGAGDAARAGDAALPHRARASTNGLVLAAAAGWLAGMLGTSQAALLAVVLGDTLYSRAQASLVLCVGLGSGALIARRVLERHTPLRLALVVCLAALAATIVAGLALWSELPGYFASFAGYIDEHKRMTIFSEREFVRLCVAGLLGLPPALCLGAAFVLAVESANRTGDGEPVRACTLGAAVALPGSVAGIAVAHVMLATFGSRVTLELTAVLALVLAAMTLRPLFFLQHSGESRRASQDPQGLQDRRREQRRYGGTALALATAVLLLVPRTFDAGRLSAGSGLSFRPQTHGAAIDSAQGAEGLVTVHAGGGDEDAALQRLSVNGQLRGQAVGARVPSARELPALLHTRGRDRALLIGLGSGLSLRILGDAGFAHIVVAEPGDAVVRMVRKHFGDVHGGVLERPDTSVRATDGRSVLLLEHASYDVVAIGASEVASPQAALLHTRELYEGVAQRLAPGGAMQQDLSLPRLSLVGLSSVLASARLVFEQVSFYFAGDRATLVACSGDGAADAARGEAALAGLVEGAGTPPADAGWLDTGAVDRLLDSLAVHLGVSVKALASTDQDMLFPYQAPRSFLQAAGQAPDSLQSLQTFAVGREGGQASAGMVAEASGRIHEDAAGEASSGRIEGDASARTKEAASSPSDVQAAD